MILYEQWLEDIVWHGEAGGLHGMVLKLMMGLTSLLLSPSPQNCEISQFFAALDVSAVWAQDSGFVVLN